MRNSLYEKRVEIEALLNTILETNAKNMLVIYHYIMGKMERSYQQEDFQYLLEQIMADIGANVIPPDNNYRDFDDSLVYAFQTAEARDRAVDDVSRAIREELPRYRETNIKGLKDVYVELLKEKGLSAARIKRNFTPDEWSRLMNNGEYSMDKLFRLMFAMELTPDEARTLASASNHPILLFKQREILLFGCIMTKIYNCDDVNEILHSFGEKDLSGTVTKY